MNTLKKLIKIILGKKIVKSLTNFLINNNLKKPAKTYSQEGEDRVLSSLLFKLNNEKDLDCGFYVDIGAHHPYRFSNTCLFYTKGWKGINIDALPGSMKSFKKLRPLDINLEIGVSKNFGTLKFFTFNEPAINTFDEDLARARCNDVWRIESIELVTVSPLSEILNKYLPLGQSIDFFSIDVEGYDLEVLQSNDWKKYRPRIVLIETFGISIEELLLDPITQYLKSMNYVPYSKTVNTTFFVDSEILKS